MIKISNYSCNDNYTIVTHSETASRVVDKLIRLAAKITECFASDIYYDICSLTNAIKAKQNYDVLLFFYENGVSTWAVSELDETTYDALKFIQVWRLTHNSSTMETKLIRACVRKEN